MLDHTHSIICFTCIRLPDMSFLWLINNVTSTVFPTQNADTGVSFQDKIVAYLGAEIDVFFIRMINPSTVNKTEANIPLQPTNYLFDDSYKGISTNILFQ